MVVQAALAVLLSRLGAGTDIPVGIAGRRADRRGAGRPGRVLRQHAGAAHRPVRRPVVRASCWAGCGRPAWPRCDHQDVPFERLVEVLAPARSLARHPLFQVMLAVQNNAPAAAGPARPAAPARCRPGAGAARFDLDVIVAEAVDADGGPAGLRGPVTGGGGPVRPGDGAG